jgi:hypothetical protein
MQTSAIHQVHIAQLLKKYKIKIFKFIVSHTHSWSLALQKEMYIYASGSDKHPSISGVMYLLSTYALVNPYDDTRVYAYFGTSTKRSKTKRMETIRPSYRVEIQNVLNTKCPKYKTSQLQNIPNAKDFHLQNDPSLKLSQF